jgi:hypothetical protein
VYQGSFFLRQKVRERLSWPKAGEFVLRDTRKAEQLSVCHYKDPTALANRLCCTSTSAEHRTLRRVLAEWGLDVSRDRWHELPCIPSPQPVAELIRRGDWTWLVCLAESRGWAQYVTAKLPAEFRSQIRAHRVEALDLSFKLTAEFLSTHIANLRSWAPLITSQDSDATAILEGAVRSFEGLASALACDSRALDLSRGGHSLCAWRVVHCNPRPVSEPVYNLSKVALNHVMVPLCTLTWVRAVISDW